ncbi:hypothetical protein GCM10009839_21110 [Catenulispora yoronensis]|uniref:Uncharacterized protein n=1 Tax=Catenulispora yoronensis TaxID=450799 RepID=A0ABN2TWF8_9ACTN
MTTKNQTLMWEVRCHPGKAPAVEEWIRAIIVPPLWQDEAVASYNAYSTQTPEEERVVLIIDYLGSAPTTLTAEPPPHLITRPGHTWIFQRLDV